MGRGSEGQKSFPTPRYVFDIFRGGFSLETSGMAENRHRSLTLHKTDPRFSASSGMGFPKFERSFSVPLPFQDSGLAQFHLIPLLRIVLDNL